jgi:hypothetical protein
MTSQQRKNLDENLKNFKSFMEFHRYAYKHDIYFNNEEWEEYKHKLKKIIENKTSNFNFDNLILPDTFSN